MQFQSWDKFALLLYELSNKKGVIMWIIGMRKFIKKDEKDRDGGW